MSTTLITGEKLVTTTETVLNPDGSRDETFVSSSAPLTSELVKTVYCNILN